MSDSALVLNSTHSSKTVARADRYYSGPPAFVVVLFLGSAILFFGCFAWSAHLVGLPLGREEWKLAGLYGSVLLASPLTTLLIFLRPPKQFRRPRRR